MEPLWVTKRDGKREPISFDKILHRIQNLCLNLVIDPAYVAQQVVSQIYPGVKTEELDDFAAQLCAQKQTEHPDYGVLAVRIGISNNRKQTPDRFSQAMRLAYENQNSSGKQNSLIHLDLYKIIETHADEIDSWIDLTADDLFDYFGFQTLLNSYLWKVNGKVIERPQYLWMRISLGLWGNQLSRAHESYRCLSQFYFTHATPTLFHAGSMRPQLLSCFLLGTEDSIDGIYKTITDCAKISKWAGGIGIHVSEIRGKGSKIEGTQGTTNGIIPMLRVYNETARYVNQCFVEGTNIILSDGVKPIEKIESGDMILAGDGSIQVVNQIFSHWIDENVIELRTKLSVEPISVTKEHQIMVLRCKSRKHARSMNLKPIFISANEITKNDWIGYPKRNLCDTLCEEDIYDGIVYWNGVIQEGEVSMKLRKNVLALEWLKTYLGVHLRIETTDEKYVYLRWKDDKKIKRNHGHGFIRGIFMLSTTEFRNCIQTDSTEKIDFLRSELLRYGCIGKNKQYELIVPRSRIFGDIIGIQYKKTYNRNYFIHNNYIWTCIESIDTKFYSGMVYDLNVEKQHTYVVSDLGVVHNSGKRNGSIAVYLEPHHPDILEFLELRKNHGAEEERCRDLFTALWVSDVFLERVEYAQKHLSEDVWWPLMDPSQHRDLQDSYGEEYKKKIETALETGCKKILILTIWKKILTSQIETGTPYITNKDAVNRKNNQSNLGTIRSSNLCNEILEYSSSEEYACCCLASINLSRFYENGEILWDELINVCGTIIRNLNQVIDLNYYPVPETWRSNERHRPLGVGIQGLADLFIKMGISWEEPRAKEINSQIAEAISYGCWKESIEMAKEHGHYLSFNGSPLSEGKFQHDLWGVQGCGRWNWEELRETVKRWGARNSLMTAYMPTASTAQIMGNQECFEPFSSLLYVRRTIAGDYVILNKYLVRELLERKLWNKELKDLIVLKNGSIQGIQQIPLDIQKLYKTVYEIKQKTLIDCAAARAPFVDQTQSMNLYFMDPSPNVVSAAILYGWKQGLKTLLYYLRSQPSIQAQQITLMPECQMCSS